MVTSIVAITIAVMWLLGFEINFWQIEGYVISAMLVLLAVRWSFYGGRYYYRTRGQQQLVTSATTIGVCGHEIFANGELSGTFKHIMDRLAVFMRAEFSNANALLFGGDHGHGIASAHAAKRYACAQSGLPETRVKTPTEHPIRGKWAFNTYHEIRDTIAATGGDCVFLCQEYQRFRVKIVIVMLGYNCKVLVAPYPPGRKLYELVLVPITILDPHHFALNILSKLKPWLVPVWRRFRQARV